MPKDAHTKAAEHHEAAAKTHRKAAEQHGSNNHTGGKQQSAEAQKQSRPRTSIRTKRTVKANNSIKTYYGANH